MIAIIVTNCASCPFAMDDATPWLCDALQDYGDPQELPPPAPAGTPQPEPPDWCPLREADRLVTLRRPR